MVEIKQHAEFVKWLNGRPNDQLLAVSTRIALRALPLILGAQSTNTGPSLQRIYLFSFRSAHAIWLASQGPNRVDWESEFFEDVLVSMSEVVDAADGAIPTQAADAIYRTCRAVFLDGIHQHVSKTAESAHWAVVEASRLASEGVEGVTDETAQDLPKIVARRVATAFWKNVDHDVAFFSRQSDPAGLASEPVWVQPLRRNIDSEISRFIRQLEGDGTFWQVWTDWYQDRLDGKPLDEELELKKALIPNEIWEQGPGVVNAEIARIIEEHNRQKVDAQAPLVRDLDGGGHPPPHGPRSPEERGPHDYDPASASLGTLTVRFKGDLGDERVEAELSRFNRLLRHRLLEITTGREMPQVFGNYLQVDYVGVQRIGFEEGSVLARAALILTCIALPYGMIATYKAFKEGLVELWGDIEIATDATILVFNETVPELPPLIVEGRDMDFRPEQEVLDDLMDKERQERLRQMGGDHPVQ